MILAGVICLFYHVNKVVCNVVLVVLFWPYSSQHTLPTHLLIHEYVDERVDDCAALGQQRWHHTSHWTNDAWWAECCHHGHNTVGRPAQ